MKNKQLTKKEMFMEWLTTVLQIILAAIMPLLLLWQLSPGTLFIKSRDDSEKHPK